MLFGRECSRHTGRARALASLATPVRRVGGAAGIVMAAAAIFGLPVGAQLPPLPTLPPLTTAPPDPGTTTTTVTLLPPLVPTEGLLTPTPGTTAPLGDVLPLPLAPPPRRTTIYKPPPVPPSTPARAAPTPAKISRPPTTTAAAADPAESTELGEGDPGFEAKLPFSSQDGALSSGGDTMELGVEASARDQVGVLSSVAAGLIALVLCGVALWLRGQSRRIPVHRRRAPAGSWRRY